MHVSNELWLIMIQFLSAYPQWFHSKGQLQREPSNLTGLILILFYILFINGLEIFILSNFGYVNDILRIYMKKLSFLTKGTLLRQMLTGPECVFELLWILNSPTNINLILILIFQIHREKIRRGLKGGQGYRMWNTQVGPFCTWSDTVWQGFTQNCLQWRGLG